ncbi:MAG: hypothetical protein JWM89_3615 [Acidimicrobiales bacterium]|jgi:anti-sigma regulatory factor (Ser/Thr protein kinase)|nr:hypothetical protein [Acidimicrobiales bacterium]
MTEPVDLRTEATSVSRDLADLARLREWLSDRLRRRPFGSEDVLQDILVMASELVSNAVLHTKSLPTVTLTVLPDVVRVAVHDDDPRLPVLEPLDVRRARGNGLRIVDAWAEQWGSYLVPGDGKEVWFTARRW